ncbi:putative protein tyrosine kinase [Lyophyllum shimeji]|uniref:Protein kinase domain-containing protein n=1 Tax=Lyophyllum shimeji TaxID=47721 RepID=A0A9P3ULN5_LYOSH|nr:putative protein tyrosine kinase [Lyophyllum shimeji]
MTAQDLSHLPREEDKVRITPKLTVDRRRNINQYVRQERIGKGQHGEVFLCKDQEAAGREVALKIMKRNNPRDRIKLLRRNQQNLRGGEVPPFSSTEHSIRKEIAVMKRCRHANIARLFEVIDDPQQDKIYIGDNLGPELNSAILMLYQSASFYLAMEYLSGGQVQWKDAEDKPILTVDETRRIIRDVVLGLEYLHHQGIIHRDIKPANLLWTKDRAIVKIIDFGVSHYSPTSELTPGSKQPEDPSDDGLFHDSDLLKRSGTPSFLAPEIVWFSDTTLKQSPAASCDTLASGSNSVTIRDGSCIPPQRPPITKAIDVWSLAVTLYCLLFGHTPFNVPESANENIYHNEFVLYNQICTRDWDVEETMGVDRVYTGGKYPRDTESEGFMVISLLDQMLQKDPNKRVTVSEVKRNPWILRGVSEPNEWIIRTSPPITKDSSSFVSRWRQASLKMLNNLPRPRRIPGL